ncbi:MAG: hypothetical protein IPM45_18290 [Acidimicrobiales bacterium]|nr:hypothetical protein [Acidimicrobiales bacterium]
MLMAGQIGLSETLTRTVIAASLEDAVAEFGALLRAEADGRNKWCEMTKAELVGRGVVTRAAAAVAAEQPPAVPADTAARLADVPAEVGAIAARLAAVDGVKYDCAIVTWEHCQLLAGALGGKGKEAC